MFVYCLNAHESRKNKIRLHLVGMVGSITPSIYKRRILVKLRNVSKCQSHCVQIYNVQCIMFSARLSGVLCCHRAPSRQYGQLHKLPWPACRTQTSPNGSPPPGYHVVCGEEWWLMRRSRTFLPSEESSKP